MTSPETKLLNKIFAKGLWKNKYHVTWCDSCGVASIGCIDPNCHGSSCNAGGCDKCVPDFNEFNKLKIHLQDYLTKEEYRIYKKALAVEKAIIEQLQRNLSDFKQLEADGFFSLNDKELLGNLLT